MQFIIHPGLARTGTTSLQNLMHTFRDALLQEGILYPQAGIREGETAHHLLAHSLFPQSSYQSIHDSRKSPSRADIFDQLRSEIDLHKPEKVFFSSEISPCYYLFDEFIEIEKHYGATREVLLTIRPQSELCKSAYSFWVMDPDIAYTGTPLTLFLQYIEEWSLMTWYRNWHQADVQFPLKVIYYHRDVVGDFLRVLEISDKLEIDMLKAVPRENRSVSPDAVSTMRALNCKLQSTEARKIASDMLSKSEVRSPSTLTLMSSDEMETLDNYYKISNDEFARLTGTANVLFPKRAIDLDSLFGEISPSITDRAILVQSTLGSRGIR
jgi:hypothetical protein